jgi:hypothetical protein
LLCLLFLSRVCARVDPAFPRDRRAPPSSARRPLASPNPGSPPGRPNRARSPACHYVPTIPATRSPAGTLSVAEEPLAGFLTALRESSAAGENRRPAHNTRLLAGRQPRSQAIPQDAFPAPGRPAPRSTARG